VRFIPAISTDEIAPGGMKTVGLDGHEIVICNCGGTYHAIEQRCGHMNAPLDLGTLDGKVVTCAMHCVQFDDMLMKPVRTEAIRTYETKIEAGWVHVAP
jgi:nitrite reductase/ring-hydroxylating ferredoxin subunit